MINQNDFAAIAALDLDPVKVKLMHAESGEGWSREKADAVEFEYRRFLYLMKTYPQEQTAPLFDVDIFWHYHILDTMKYMQDCEAVFGYYLHHFPYVGLRGEVDEAAHHRVGERMKELYEQTFGESYLHAAQAVEQVAWSSAPPLQAAQSWPGKEAIRSAWSSAPGVQSAWSSATVGKSAWSSATVGKSAWSSATVNTAWSSAPGMGTADGFYATRPSLASAA